jgi:hypothetical protein
MTITGKQCALLTSFPGPDDGGGWRTLTDETKAEIPFLGCGETNRSCWENSEARIDQLTVVAMRDPGCGCVSSFGPQSRVLSLPVSTDIGNNGVHNGV